MVFFNQPASAAVGGVNPSVLRIANAAVLANWPMNSLQQTILQLSGRDVTYVADLIIYTRVRSSNYTLRLLIKCLA